MTGISSRSLTGAIDTPRADALVDRGKLRVAGWALDGEGPVTTAFVLLDGYKAASAGIGVHRKDIGAQNPHVPGAERAGWEAIVDLRTAQGPEATVSLLARSSDGTWAEIGHTQVRVEDSGAHASGLRSRAVFTIVQDEATFLPVWLDYYSRYFDASDIFVLDHDSTDRTTERLGDRCHVVPVHRSKSFDHEWLHSTVEEFQSFLLSSYDAVLFSEADEFVVVDPSAHDGLDAYIESLRATAACCTGYNVVHYPDEPPLRFDEPLLAQRSYWHASELYSKRLLGRMPLAWSVGFHAESNAPAIAPDPHLYLIHLHRADYEHCLARHRAARQRDWSEYDVRAELGWQNRIVDPDEFRDWFFHGSDIGGPRETIPDRIRQVL